jgi:hypothetical protein
LIKEILGWRRRRRARRAAEAAGPAVEVDVADMEVKNEIIANLVQEEPVAESPEAVMKDSPPTRSLRSRKKIIE